MSLSKKAAARKSGDQPARSDSGSTKAGDVRHVPQATDADAAAADDDTPADANDCQIVSPISSKNTKKAVTMVKDVISTLRDL